MQDHVKYLVVEDNNKWSQAISACVKRYFLDTIGMSDERVRDFSAYDGDQANQQLTAGMFDLLTLDMNLGEGMSGSKISGRDLLQEIAALQGERGAYFIIIITGAIHEGAELELLHGREAAARMRYGAYNEAVQKIPAERVRIIHKPNTHDVEVGVKELIPHLHSALDQYCTVSRERNIFRPLSGAKAKGKKRYWEFRYNGGERRNIAETPGFEMFRSALAHPNYEMRIIALMKAIARSSGVRPVVPPSKSPGDSELYGKGEEHEPETNPKSLILGGVDPKSKGALGLDYSELKRFTILSDTPVDPNPGVSDIMVEDLILGLLATRKSGGDLKELLERCLRDLQLSAAELRSVPAKMAYYLAKPHHLEAKNEFGDDNVIEHLTTLLKEVKPLVEHLIACQSKSPQSESATQPGPKRPKVRLNTGADPKETINARQHWKRVLAELKRHKLHELAEHLDNRMRRGKNAKGKLTYHFNPEEGFAPFWLTQ